MEQVRWSAPHFSFHPHRLQLILARPQDGNAQPPNLRLSDGGSTTHMLQRLKRSSISKGKGAANRVMSVITSKVKELNSRLPSISFSPPVLIFYEFLRLPFLYRSVQLAYAT